MRFEKVKIAVFVNLGKKIFECNALLTKGIHRELEGEGDSAPSECSKA